MKTFIFLCFSLYSPLIFSQNLQFYREDLTFEIKEGYFYVDGIYNFCNNGNSPIRQVLFYPFPINSIYGKVDSINATNLEDTSRNIIIDKTEKGFFFKVELKPFGIGKYKISYRQILLKNKAEYILLTTQKWGISLENASYKLIISENLKITSTSYVADSTMHENNNEIFYWSRKDFMPDKNMIFYFTK